MKQLLPKLITCLRRFRDKTQQLEVPKFTCPVPKEDSQIISHAWFWPRVGQFFREKDVVVAETGEFADHVPQLAKKKSAVLIEPLQEHRVLVCWTSRFLRVQCSSAKFCGEVLDGPLVSIPLRLYRLEMRLLFPGSTLGASFAARDRKLGRTILFIGDGSM